jgi:hypothetical protein
MTPLDWIQMHPKSAHSISLGANTRDYQWEWQVLQTFSKMELMGSLEYARAYIDDLLWISRNSLEDHLEKKLEEVLRRLRDAGLKVNADKSTLCALEIEYLGYVLSKDGIKPQSNKVQAILAIQLPKGVKQQDTSLAWLTLP